MMELELNSNNINIFSEVDISERDLSELKFDEIFNLDEIQKLQDTFAFASGVASIITDIHGVPITKPSNFSYLCLSIVRQNQSGSERCIYSDSVIGKANPDGPSVQKCLSAGLWEGGAGIKLGERHIANWLIGQVLVEPYDEKELVKYARQLGVDEKEYAKALELVPRMSKKKLTGINQVLFLFARQLSELALKNIQRLQEREKRQKAELKSESLCSVARAINSADNLYDVIENAKDVLSRIIYFESFSIAKYDKQNEGISFSFFKDEKGPDAALERLNNSESLISEVLRTQKPVHFKRNDAPPAATPAVSREVANIPECVEWLGVPLQIKGEILGALCIQNYRRDGCYSREDLELLEAVCEQIAVAVKHRLSEEKLKEAKDLARKSEKLKTEFLAQISHEIRTPLNAILSFNALIRQEMEDKIQEEIRDGFNIIERGSKRIIRTIDLLLNMSAVQTGNYEVCLARINIDETLRSIAGEFAVLAKKKDLSLRLENNTETSVILADGYTITQIFTNILDNAVKYTKEGNISVRVFNNSVGKLTVEVSDTGIGISKEFLPDLFKPFLQEEMGYTRRYEGNGLGLALVKKYCELNKADIRVKSEKGEGSTFTVTFNQTGEE